MLCQRCKKKEANVFYRETINGKETNYSVCSDCAKEMEEKGEIKNHLSHFENSHLGQSGGYSIGLGDLFGSLFGAVSAVPGARESALGKRCSLCGASYADIAKNGKAGCPQCYSVFSGELSGTVNRIHGNTAHRGRAPKAWKEKLDRTALLESLKKELSEAIAAEEFEKAAELRDKIRATEKSN
ncbi:MAG: UvrB/UvrC motif-containing protein [Clostridia bacterium]|nr:UvrB/UvrC motif-containing protein [Clostridia bacterium]